MTRRKHTEEELRAAVTTSTSIRQLLLNLGMAARGGNYQMIKRRLQQLDIDTAHFTGKGWSKGKSLGVKTPTEKYLNNEVAIDSHRLRLRLIREGYFEAICSSCNLSEWLGEPIPLELDHIDGNNENNNLSNLRLLCPNCHARTPTYRGKNKRSRV